MLEAEVGESPHVAQTHTVADAGQNKLQRVAPLWARLALTLNVLVEKQKQQMCSQVLFQNELCVSTVHAVCVLSQQRVQGCQSPEHFSQSERLS